MPNTALALNLARYRRILVDARPKFRRREWLAIFEAVDGVPLDDEKGWAVRGLGDLLYQANFTKHLDYKWNVRMEYLLPTLVAMPLAGKTAVAEMAERFRARGRATPDEFFDALHIP